MPLTFLVGGARSGKSALAVRLAAAHAHPVTFVATAEAGDDDMAGRIARHRRQRPSHWTTVEEPVDLAGALRRCPDSDTVIVDCLTLWVSNLAGAADEDVLGEADQRAAALAAGRHAPVIAVSNEVGSGIVPADADTRPWRDLLGSVNALFAGRADRAALVVAGRVVPLATAESLLDG